MDLGFDLGLGQRGKGHSRKAVGRFEQALDPPPAKLLAQQRFHGLRLEKTAVLGFPSYAVWEAQLDLDLGSGALIAHGTSFLLRPVYTTTDPTKTARPDIDIIPA